MAERDDERYRGEAYRGERGYAREERGFDGRVSEQIRPSFDEEEAGRRREAGEAERRRAREADRLYHRDYGPYDYGWGSERGWTERGYGYPGKPWEAPDRWRGWRDRDYEARRRGYGGETGHDTSWGGPSSSSYGQYTSQYLPGYDMGEGGDHRWREGPFAGRGPKGYQRADDRIREDVCDRLTDAPFLDASGIEVTVNNGEVTLSGTVPNREQKRRSEDLIEHVTGVREVNNTLRINRAPEGTNVGP
jgi:hypothetical protein